MKQLHPKAKAILTVRGYINGKETQLTETELVSQIKKVTKGKCIEVQYEFKDIQAILEDDIFKSFVEKLRQAGYDEQKREGMQDIAIRAMMEAKL